MTQQTVAAASSPTLRNNKRRRTTTTTVLSSLLVAASSIRSSYAFVGVPSRPSSTTRSSTNDQTTQQQQHFQQHQGLYFQNPVDPEYTYLATATQPIIDSLLSTTRTSASSTTGGSISDVEDESAQRMTQLHKAMRTSLFTEAETLKLSYAIEEASILSGFSLREVHILQAGAAEFCTILTETTELGLQALIAAVFHYCATHSSHRHHHNQQLTAVQWKALESFGGSVGVNIARDAARLQQLELVAATGGTSAAHNTFAFGLSPIHRGSAIKTVRFTHDAADNLRKLLLSETGDWRALTLRCSAALLRLRKLVNNDLPRETAVRYGREALFLYAPLASRLGMHRLKNELEDAAFRVLYPRQYERVTSSAGLSNSTMTDMLEVLHNVQRDMTSMLENDNEFAGLVDSFTVSARVKEPYSLWKKMLRNNYQHFLQVPDAIALRIVFDAKKLSSNEPATITRARERALCYYSQELCTQKWAPMSGNGRFKDYVKVPKANGYQSLHYTAQTEYKGEDWTLEIQVRSGQMHQVAEFGLASHWDYKESQSNRGKKSNKKSKKSSSATTPAFGLHHHAIGADQSSAAYLRKVQEWYGKSAFARDSVKASDVASSNSSNEDMTLATQLLNAEARLRAERIRARTKRLEPYIQALSDTQSDLTREFVFVFLTENTPTSEIGSKVVALPSGACVLDALREGEKSFGYNLFSVKENQLALNGVETTVTRKLSNGDVLTLPHFTGKQQTFSM